MRSNAGNTVWNKERKKNNNRVYDNGKIQEETGAFCDSVSWNRNKELPVRIYLDSINQECGRLESFVEPCSPELDWKKQSRLYFPVSHLGNTEDPLLNLDRRYQERYNMSMIENLKHLREKGMNEFLETQEGKYECPKCGDVTSVHDGKCYACRRSQKRLK